MDGANLYVNFILNFLDLLDLRLYWATIFSKELLTKNILIQFFAKLFMKYQK